MTDLSPVRWLGTSLQPPLEPRTWPSGQSRRPCTGFMSRESNSPRDPAIRPFLRSYVHDLRWEDSQVTEGGAIPQSVVDELGAEHDFAESEDMVIRLRLFTGIRAPEWAKTLGGYVPIDWYTSDNTISPAGTVGPFWRADYAAAYDDWVETLAAVLAPLDRFGEVTIALNTTVYSEPFIRSWPYVDVNAVVAAGYTVEEDLEAFNRSIRTHLDHLVPVDVASTLAFNPFQRLDLSKPYLYVGDTTIPLSLMRAMRDALGKYGVLGNNSLGTPIDVRGARYETIWTALKDYRHATTPFAVPTYFQTMTLPKMKGQFRDDGVRPLNTAQFAAFDLKSGSLEMPRGWTDDPDPEYRIEPAEATVLNEAFAANVAEVTPG